MKPSLIDWKNGEDSWQWTGQFLEKTTVRSIGCRQNSFWKLASEFCLQSTRLTDSCCVRQLRVLLDHSVRLIAVPVFSTAFSTAIRFGFYCAIAPSTDRTVRGFCLFASDRQFANPHVGANAPRGEMSFRFNVDN
jgi:hypothetical protein